LLEDIFEDDFDIHSVHSGQAYLDVIADQMFDLVMYKASKEKGFVLTWFSLSGIKITRVLGTTELAEMAAFL